MSKVLMVVVTLIRSVTTYNLIHSVYCYIGFGL